ncbi:putative G protein [Trifolium pratense virus B]|uniref:Putative G protein n=1 Tax=Trifolium pratense virus B TaxID=2448907 RepID=A0A510C2I3_9RHAB|nr:putative G protein [Trifolium pratense virus B]AYH53272.1 putative G protein [Trifolium pratense virus B]
MSFSTGAKNVVSLCFIFSCLLAIKGDFNHSVGPLAICSLQMEDARAYAESCYRLCTRDREPSAHGFVDLYSETSQKGGPDVIRCTKVRIEQTFTETWSFSTISSEPTRTMLDVTRAECDNEIKSICPKSNCYVKAPNSLEAEFHYASDTVVSKDYIELMTLPSGLDYLEEHLRITPALGGESYPASDGQAFLGKALLLWDPNFESPACPFTSVQRHGCDRYDKPADLINCRRSRFVIPNLTDTVELKGHCKGIRRAPSGLLWQWTDVSKSGFPGSKRLALTLPAASETGLEALRYQVAEALDVIDEDMCQTQCEILDLVLRADRKREVLTRIGGSYMVISKSGYLRRCHPAIGCKLVKPHMFCGGPNRVAVSCSGKVFMWNPQKSYLESDMDCPRHTKDSKLTFTVGSHEYNIDDNLHVALPDKEHFGIAHDIVAKTGDMINKELVNPEDLRKSWIAHVERDSSVSITPINEGKNISTWEPDLSFGFEGLKSVGRRVSDFFSRVTLWLSVLLTLAALMLGAKAWGYIRTSAPRSDIKHVRVPTSETSATWM